ncbi:hypothetical protein B0T26DRAFT_676057 [Lasiosphaeria miniovina]|uniref:C2 domain-containing protein n=1 Tax=Lasiosphaeria miniovina TaxID=1954250 RepID=A0AA40E035_9PEZI|nr:uncharacterized protein B0T26DRAFT_676057 [Lasiosphaeria miniovina]KAK0717798.1 hypothetical protein B0T26DRAFT_676057 [Lasiosphaeria miniovina]
MEKDDSGDDGDSDKPNSGPDTAALKDTDVGDERKKIGEIIIEIIALNAFPNVSHFETKKIVCVAAYDKHQRETAWAYMDGQSKVIWEEQIRFPVYDSVYNLLESRVYKSVHDLPQYRRLDISIVDRAYGGRNVMGKFSANMIMLIREREKNVSSIIGSFFENLGTLEYEVAFYPTEAEQETAAVPLPEEDGKMTAGGSASDGNNKLPSDGSIPLGGVLNPGEDVIDSDEDVINLGEIIGTLTFSVKRLQSPALNGAEWNEKLSYRAIWGKDLRKSKAAGLEGSAVVWDEQFEFPFYDWAVIPPLLVMIFGHNPHDHLTGFGSATVDVRRFIVAGGSRTKATIPINGSKHPGKLECEFVFIDSRPEAAGTQPLPPVPDVEDHAHGSEDGGSEAPASAGLAPDAVLNDSEFGVEIGTISLIVIKVKNLPANIASEGAKDLIFAISLGSQRRFLMARMDSLDDQRSAVWNQVLRSRRSAGIIGRASIDLDDIVVEGGSERENWYRFGRRGMSLHYRIIYHSPPIRMEYGGGGSPKALLTRVAGLHIVKDPQLCFYFGFCVPFGSYLGLSF